jgi:hypothetical protein
MYAEFAGDPIVQSLAFEDQRHFVVLLCLKCNGTLDRPMDVKVRDRIICRGIGLDPVAAAEAKRRLEEVGLIDAQWQPTGWSARQFISDKSTDRVRKYRKNKEACNVSSSLQKQNCNAPDTDTDTDTEHTPQPPKGGRRARQIDPEPFATFWAAYPAKKGKQDAIRAFAKLTPEEASKAIADIPARLANDRQWADGYIPNPSTYLNGKRWEDDITPSRNGANQATPTPPQRKRPTLDEILGAKP